MFINLWGRVILLVDCIASKSETFRFFFFFFPCVTFPTHMVFMKLKIWYTILFAYVRLLFTALPDKIFFFFFRLRSSKNIHKMNHMSPMLHNTHFKKPKMLVTAGEQS